MFPSDPIAPRDPEAAARLDSDAATALAFVMDDSEDGDAEETERQFERRAARLLELPLTEELVP